MSSSTALSSSHSANLIQILRQANAHYSRLASIIRASIHPTHHARKRAAALRLTVCIQKALNLDPKQISTIPLPVLDKVVTPPLYSRVSLIVDSPAWTRRDPSVTSRWSMTTSDADSDVADSATSTNGTEKLVVRIKRKSAEPDDDALEKRPKYERKEWAISQRRIIQRTTPSRSGRF